MKISRVLLSLAMLAGLMTAPAWAVPSDLGTGNQFGILSFYGMVSFYPVSELEAAYVNSPPECPGAPGCTPDTGAVRIGLSGIDYLGGDAIASLSKSFAIVGGQQNTVEGECVTGGGGILFGPLSYCNGGTDKSGTNYKVTTLLPGAISDAYAYSQTLAGETPTQTLSAIYLNSGQNYALDPSHPTEFNLISVPSIITKGYNTITINAGPSATVVLNVGSSGSPGQFDLGPGTKIVLAGGITPDHVLFNVLGYGPPVTIDRYSTVNGTILAPGDSISVATELGTNYKAYKNWGTINGALIAGKNIYIGCLVKIYFYPFTPSPQQPETPPEVTSACENGSSLAALVQGNNVIAYVPKAAWFNGKSGVAAINIEGSSITPALIATNNNVNSCAANSATGQIVCTSNGTDVYLISGTTLNTTLASSAISPGIIFSGDQPPPYCETCGVTINPATNQALLTVGTTNGAAALQYLDLDTNTFETPIPTASGLASEEILIDPVRNLILSPNEVGGYELAEFSGSAPTALSFFEKNFAGAPKFDSAAEDCSTGIALASIEFTQQLYLADLTQATLTPGSPGTWSTTGSQFQNFSPDFVGLSSGTTGISIAQGTHLGIVTGEFGGNSIAAIQLPATSGSGTPAATDWVACALPNEPGKVPFSQGLDPHTVTAYLSPVSGDAIGLTADGGALTSGTATYVAVVDLNKMLDTSIVPRTAGTHTCSAGTLPVSVVSYVAVP